MFKSNRTNQILKIIGIWIVYLLVFMNDTFTYPQDRTFIIFATVFYILLTAFFLWRIKNPSKRVRSEENEV